MNLSNEGEAKTCSGAIWLGSTDNEKVELSNGDPIVLSELRAGAEINILTTLKLRADYPNSQGVNANQSGTIAKGSKVTLIEEPVTRRNENEYWGRITAPIVNCYTLSLFYSGFRSDNQSMKPYFEYLIL